MKFEYTARVVDGGDAVDSLNRAGQEGWQCVAIVPLREPRQAQALAYLMREIVPPGIPILTERA